MAVKKDGKNAITHFDVIKRYNGYTYLKVNIETGRTHQIRVHLSHIGYPIIGDEVYSNGKNPFGVKGQMLHAKELEFTHPTTGKRMKIEAPIPEYFEEVLEIEKPEFLCHMGDLEGSEDYIRMITRCPLAMVSGNNDFWTDLNQEVTFELHGFRIFMTHGHYYYPHAGLDQLKSAGRRNKADIVLFGHTHRPTLLIDEDIIVGVL